MIELFYGALVGTAVQQAWGWILEFVGTCRGRLSDRQLLEAIANEARTRRKSGKGEAQKADAGVEVVARSLARGCVALEAGISRWPSATRGYLGHAVVRDVVDRSLRVVEELPTDRGALARIDLSDVRVEVDPPGPPDELLGSVLSGYTLQRLLGCGGFGRVYMGVNAVGKRVAVKAPHHAGLAKRALREAKMLASLNHPAIVKLENVVLGDITHPHLIFELVEGPSLRDLLQRGPLAETVVREIAVAVLAALHHAHARGILHLDLKPENVLLLREEAPDRVKVVDFGVGRLAAEAETALKLSREVSSLEVVAGTPDYMAPEQREGRSNLDGRADLFSLGVMVFELLTGRRPVGNASLRGNARDLSELFARTYVYDPADRLASAEQGLAILRRGTEPRTLTCVECGDQFTFTVEEQEFHAKKGYANEPKRCPMCREARCREDGGGGGGGAGRGNRPLFKTTCAGCGGEVEVPYEPKRDRPVYCYNCFKKQREGTDKNDRMPKTFLEFLTDSLGPGLDKIEGILKKEEKPLHLPQLLDVYVQRVLVGELLADGLWGCTKCDWAGDRASTVYDHAAHAHHAKLSEETSLAGKQAAMTLVVKGGEKVPKCTKCGYTGKSADEAASFYARHLRECALKFRDTKATVCKVDNCGYATAGADEFIEHLDDAHQESELVEQIYKPADVAARLRKSKHLKEELAPLHEWFHASEKPADEWLKGLADALKKDGRFAEVPDGWTLASKIPPADQCRGVARGQKGDLAKAAEQLKAYLNVERKDVAELKELASLMEQLGNLRSATVAYREYLEQNPTDVDSWRALGRLYLGQNHLESAREALRQTLSMSPGDAEAAALARTVEERILRGLGPSSRARPRDSQSRSDDDADSLKNLLTKWPGMSQPDSWFLNIAHAYKFVTERQLEECMEVYQAAQDEHLRGLGEVFCEKGYLSPSQVETVNRVVAYVLARVDDKLYAQLAVKHRLATQAQVTECLTEQKNRFYANRTLVRLSDLMKERCLIVEKHHRALAEAVEIARRNQLPS